MNNTYKKYYELEGYETKDLIQYGSDHFDSSLILFNNGPHTYDSAGYLAHLGIELYFKALMLYDLKYFINEHKFKKLHIKDNMPKSFFEISKENKRIYFILEKFSELRYPKTRRQIEIGSKDVEKIRGLKEEIVGKFPEKLKDEYENFDDTKKGGRRLIIKKK